MWVFRALFILGIALPAFAQEWPAKVVKFVSP